MLVEIDFSMTVASRPVCSGRNKAAIVEADPSLMVDIGQSMMVEMDQ